MKTCRIALDRDSVWEVDRELEHEAFDSLEELEAARYAKFHENKVKLLRMRREKSMKGIKPMTPKEALEKLMQTVADQNESVQRYLTMRKNIENSAENASDDVDSNVTA